MNKKLRHSTEFSEDAEDILGKLKAIRSERHREYLADPEKFQAEEKEYHLRNYTIFSRRDGTRFNSAEELKEYIENN